jgi:DHA2 family multidrug resistance protein
MTDKHPVIELRLFQLRNFRVGVGVFSIGYFSFQSVNVVFPLWLQTTVGYTATWAGLAIAPVGLFVLVAAPIVGMNMNRMNLRMAASFALCIFGISVFWTSSLNDQASFGQFALPRLLQGMGIAFFALPLNQIFLAGISPQDLASASGLSNFMRTMSGSMSTAVTVWIWNRRTDYHHAVLSEHIRNSAGGWTQYQTQLGMQGITGHAAFAHADQLIGVQASTLALNDVFLGLGFVFFLLVPLVWFARPPFGARHEPAV